MDFISNPNLPNILLKAERRDNLIAIQTYDRAHGRKGRFLICMDALQAWLDGDRERPFYDSDCGNFLVLRLYGGFCKMQLFWLSEYGSGDLHGIRQDDSRVTLYPDGADSFYFDASGSWPLCGGLILHDGIARTPHGNLPKLYYGIHT